MMKSSFLRLAALAGWLVLSWNSSVQASPPPTDPTGRCNVIHAYEGLCGNVRSSQCISKTGVDYWHNMSHQTTWDNFYNLCVTPAPYTDRHSHECIAHFSLASTCVSTVEPLVEYVAVYTAQAQTAIHQEPQYVAATNYQQVAYLCSLTNENRTKINNYVAACGQVAPAACSGNTSLKSEYLAFCGEKKPCQCLHEQHCGDPACPAPEPEPGVLGEPPLPPPPTPLGGEPIDPGIPPLPPVPGDTTVGSDSNIALGSGEDKSPASGTNLGGGGESGAVGAKGCALAIGVNASHPGITLFLSSLIFGMLGLRFRPRSK